MTAAQRHPEEEHNEEAKASEEALSLKTSQCAPEENAVPVSAKVAVRKPQPRSFERPTENFTRKTGMRDKGPPGFEYNRTDHLAIATGSTAATGSAVFLSPSPSRSAAALPGVHVHGYAATPTRDGRLAEADMAAQARVEHALRLAAKARRERKLLMPRKTQSNTHPEQAAPVVSTLPLRAPRPRELEERAWREALKAKTQAVSASPREGKIPRVGHVQGLGQKGTPGKAFRRAAPVKGTKGMFQGVRVPSDAFQKPFAGGTELDALPGRLESLVFPQRYVDWPRDRALPAFATDVVSSPIRHAAAFRSQQPRIVLDDRQRETRGWDGPGAYEWDDPTPPTTSGSDKRGWERDSTPPSATGILRPKGVVVRDPSRVSAFFRPQSRGFIGPSQTNVRNFASAPVSDVILPGTVGREGKDEEGGSAILHHKNTRSGNERRKLPRRLWMFQPTGKPYEPVLATEGWSGPGAYDMEGSLAVKVREPGRLSPVFRAGSGRQERPSRRDRQVVAFPSRPGGRPDSADTGSADGDVRRTSPDTPSILASWASPLIDFMPPEPKTIAHDVRNNPVRFSSCFLSIKDRFAPVGPYASFVPDTPPWVGPGDVSRWAASATGGPRRGQSDERDRARGRGYRCSWGPVERYDLVSIRQQPPSSKTWLGTSIRPGLPYNPALKVDEVPAVAVPAGQPVPTTPPSSNTDLAPTSSSQAISRVDLVDSDTGGSIAPIADRPSVGVGGDDGAGGQEHLREEVPNKLKQIEATAGSTSGPQQWNSTCGITTAARNTPTRRTFVSAAEAVKLAVVAAATAGLAQDWAGSCRGEDQHFSEGVQGQDTINITRNRDEVPLRTSQRPSDDGRQDATGDQDNSGQMPSARTHVQSSGEGQKWGANHNAELQNARRALRLSLRECRKAGIVSNKQAGRCTGPEAISFTHEPSGKSSTAERHSSGREKQRPGDGRRGASMETGAHTMRCCRNSTDGMAVWNAGTSTGADPAAASTTAYSNATEAACDYSPTPSASYLEQPRWGGASQTMHSRCSKSSIFDEPTHGGDGRRGLIRTVGRAKRGPCMLTLASLREHGDHRNRRDNTPRREKSKSQAVIWEAEANGGLFGPGEIRILVC